MQSSDTLSLGQALGILRRRALLVVFCVLVVAAAAYAFSKHETKKYSASASLIFSNNPLSEQIAGLAAVNSGSVLAQQASNVESVRLGDMAAKTALLLGGGLTEEKVADSVSVSGQGESSVVVVSATSSSPALAARIANTYIRQFVVEQQTANHQYFKSALALVNHQLAAIPTKQRFSAAAVALQNRAQTLRLLDELRYGNVQVAQEATPPSSPSSPKTSKNTLLGGLLGLIIGLALAFVLERVERDRRIRTPRELEETYELPLLGAVPYSTNLHRRSNGGQTTLTPAETEAFRLIRAHLRFFNVDRELRTVLIASASTGEGKSTIAANLAQTAARMGSRVLLIEADLRKPTLTRQLQINAGPGLPALLSGSASMSQATQSIPLDQHHPEQRTLDILTAGETPPPNPGEMLESHAMEAVLEQAKSIYDLVIIDTPPLTAVSDAFPLLRKVDGVIITGWIGRTQRENTQRLYQTLNASHAPLLGVIANATNPTHNPPTYPQNPTHTTTTPTNNTPTREPTPTTTTNT